MPSKTYSLSVEAVSQFNTEQLAQVLENIARTLRKKDESHWVKENGSGLNVHWELTVK